VSTPSFAQLCLAERTFNASMLPALRRLLFCGETLPAEVAAQLLERFPDAAVWNTYGPTEATVATTSVEITRDVLATFPVLPVGYPKPGTEILIVADDGSEAPAGERGEIVIAGPNVSPGYLGRPDLNARSFFTHDAQRAYRTGDWGRCRDRLLFFEGRIDSQVKLHGYRIELGDVEANLRALPGVLDAAVIAVTRAGVVDSLAAFVVAPGRDGVDGRAAAAALREQLGARLPAYMVPRTIRFIASLPLTANGKADRRALAELLT
jgi:D-alanine--poly(phosphoribitol) ligase subunit 1